MASPVDDIQLEQDDGSVVTGEDDLSGSRVSGSSDTTCTVWCPPTSNLAERPGAHSSSVSFRPGVLGEVDGHAASFVVEDGDEFETGTERFEVLAQGGDANVFGVLELRDRTLGDLQPPCKFGLADGLGVTELPQSDLLEGLGPLGGKPVRGPGRASTSLRSSENLVRPSDQSFTLQLVEVLAIEIAREGHPPR